MKKTNQFDDIKAGELIRFLKNPMRGNSPRNNWSFGIVAYRLKTTFCVYPVGRPSYSKGITIRYDGMNGPGKDAPQIVFFLTPEEEQSPLIQEYKNIVKEQYKLKQKQLNLWTKIRDAAVLTEEDSEIPF